MIGDEGVVLVPFDIPGATPFFIPMDAPQATQEILGFVARYPQARLTLFADNLAQDYRSDSLPRLSVFDRAKLIDRRLQQTFPSARLTAHLRFRQTKDKFLLIGLHDSNPVFLWADRLRARTPAITLLPVEGARLSARLMPESSAGWSMLVARQKSGGLRQIVTFKNDLVFTRLTPLPPSGLSPKDEASIIARDIKASLDYLTRQGLRNASDLSVLLLTPDTLDQAEVFANLGLNSTRALSPYAAAALLKLPFAVPQDERDSDLLFAAHFLAAARPVLSLRLPDARRDWLNQTICLWGLRLSFLALGLAMMDTLWRSEEWMTSFYNVQKESRHLEETRHVLAQAQASAAPLTEPLGRLRQALERRRIYEQPTPAPWQAMDAMGTALDETGKILSLEWKKESDDAPDTLTLSIRMTNARQDRAETVAAFAKLAQNIADSLPDYTLAISKTPYPALPQDSVTASPAPDSPPPIGEIILQRKPHD